jgi:AhpD family alkylhydroperoxidase
MGRRIGRCRSSSEPPLIRLVQIRASQINGWASCINMHAEEARANGETELPIYLLSRSEMLSASSTSTPR